MSFAVIGAAGVLICWKWGDWRHWPRYYTTILYLLIGDLVADVLLYNHNLWAYGSFIEQYPVLEICVMLLLYPATVILYLSFYPESRGRQVLYVALWVGIYTLAEFIASKTGGFCYHDGWTIWHSMAFNLVMFPLLRIHFKKPLLVWPISAALCFLMLWWFRVPLAR